MRTARNLCFVVFFVVSARPLCAIMNGRGQDIFPVAAVFYSSATVLDSLGVGSAQVRLGNNIIVSSETSAALGGGVRVSSNVYIVGFSSASRYYGDGSALSGVSGGSAGPSIAVSTINPAATTPYGGVNITTNVFVGGQLTGTTVSNGSTNIDFGSGNLQYTSSNCGAMTLYNMKDGGSYTLAVQGTTAATCSFTAGGFTVHLPPGHGATTDTKHTVYTFVALGTHVYVSWIPGF